MTPLTRTPAHVRDHRLRSFLAAHGITQGMPENAAAREELQHQQLAQAAQQNQGSALDRLKEQFYYPGDARLKDVRRELIMFSLQRAEKRLCTARERVGMGVGVLLLLCRCH